MCEVKMYSPNTGTAKISTANSNLNGTGTIVDIMTGASNGTVVRSLIIKSQVQNAQGMVRLFVKPGGGSYNLIQEVMIPATNPTGQVQSFSATIDSVISLSFGEVLAASTQNAETFSILANGMDIDFCHCPE